MYFKKITFLPFILLLIVITLTTKTVYANNAVINTENLNVREGPGTYFEKVDQVFNGQSYPIIQSQNDWVEIQLEGKTGWVTKEYITIREKQLNMKEPKQDRVKSITIPQENTQIRNGPSTNNDIIYFAKKSTTFDIISENDNWYEVTNDDVTGFLYKKFVERRPDSFSLKNKKIVIDSGHGGRDVGAIGVSGTFEKDIAQKTTLLLEKELTTLGAEVILTRSKDNYISLESRASLSNLHDTDAFISIHYNSVPELPNVTGIGTYYYHDHNQSLANTIQNEIIKESNAKNRDIAFGDFQVLRQNLKPAVLVELGFISNHANEQLLLTAAYHKSVTKGVVNGLQKYFSN